MLQNEIKSSQNLLNDSGRLQVSGWARAPRLDYDRTDVKYPFFRVREWDHYIVCHKDYALSVSVADYSYFGMATAMLMDFRGEPRCLVKSKITPLTMGRLNMPNSSKAGDTNYDDRRLGMKFSRSANMRFLKSEFMSFYDGKLLNVSISLDQPDRNTIAISSGFPKKGDAFVYAQKDIGMPAAGFVKFGGEEFEFSPENSCGFLDWGRGVLPRSYKGFWSSLSTTVQGKPFAVNFGGGPGDMSQGMENAIFYDGNLYKIDNLSVQKPKQSLGQRWNFYTKDKRIQLSFTPFLEGVAQNRFLLFSVEKRLLFGHFEGRVRLEGNQEIRIGETVGFTQWIQNQL